MRGLSPDARVSLFPWVFPFWEHINHTTAFGESQGKRQFQKTKLKTVPLCMRHYPQFIPVDISPSNTRYVYRGLEVLQYQTFLSL